MKKWLRLFFILLLMFLFLYLFFRKVDWDEVLVSLGGVNIRFLVLTILLAPLHFITRALRWKYLLIHEKREVKFSTMFSGNVLGFTVSFLFPGRLGELIKPLYLAHKEKMSKGFAVGTVVVERVFDLFTMCALLSVFLLFRPSYDFYLKGKSDAFPLLYNLGVGAVAFASFLLVVILLLYFLREKSLSFFSLLLRLFPARISEKILGLTGEFITGLKFFHSLGNLLVYILFSFVVWVGNCFFYWAFLLAFRISPPFVFLFPYTFLTFIGAAIPTPGMVGGFHYFSKLGLTSLFGISSSMAVGMTVVVHAIQYVVTCLMGYAILWKESISLFQLKKIGEELRR